MPGTTGSTSREGIAAEWVNVTDAVPPGGCVFLNAHTGWSPPGAEIVMRIREPAR